MNNEIQTKHFSLVPMSTEELQSLRTQTDDREVRALLNALERCEENGEDPGWYTIWKVHLKKDGTKIGSIRFHGRPQNGKVYVSCQLSTKKRHARMGAEGLKRMTKWAFKADKKLYVLSSCLSEDDAAATRILEGAGFIQVFESDGVVHYEKNRPHLPMLTIIMMLFTLLGFLFGALFHNIALFTTIFMIAGVLPGAMIDKMLHRRREKRTQS